MKSWPAIFQYFATKMIREISHKSCNPCKCMLVHYKCSNILYMEGHLICKTSSMHFHMSTKLSTLCFLSEHFQFGCSACETFASWYWPRASTSEVNLNSSSLWCINRFFMLVRLAYLTLSSAPPSLVILAARTPWGIHSAVVKGAPDYHYKDGVDGNTREQHVEELPILSEQ